MSSDLKVLVAIPALNEQENLQLLFTRFPKRIEGVESVEILVVDDGSSDNTSEIAKNFGAHVIRHEINQGLGSSFRDAIDFAIERGFDFLVTIDADNQFDPNDIPRLLKPLLLKESKFVTASRFLDTSLYPKNIPNMKLYGNFLMSFILSFLVGRKIFDVSCGYRAYTREALLNLNLHGRFTYTQEVILDLEYKKIHVKEIPVEVKYFEERKSRIAHSLVRYGYNSLFIILRTVRDFYPLRFFWSLGLINFFAAVILESGLIIHYVNTGEFRGMIWAGVTGGILFLASLLFFIVGLLADMMDRHRLNQEKIIYLLKSQKN